MAALMAAKHDYELKADTHTHLHLDHRHMGVGGDDSWSPSLHKARTLPVLGFFAPPVIASASRVVCVVSKLSQFPAPCSSLFHALQSR